MWNSLVLVRCRPTVVGFCGHDNEHTDCVWGAKFIVWREFRFREQLHNYLLTYLLTYSMQQSPSWEANGFLASQEISHIYGTRRFITAFKNARHLSLAGASSIQSIPTHSTSWRSILILSSHLRLGIPSGLFPSGFPTKTLYTPLLSPYVLHAQPISFFTILSPAQYLVSSTDH